MEKIWNYITTYQKPTSVTHSTVGNFTGPNAINLIVGKGSWIEILSYDQGLLHTILDVPIYGEIEVLKIFRPPGAQQDFLLIVTATCNVSLLQWDSGRSELLTRSMGDVSEMKSLKPSWYQGGIVDPDYRAIGLQFCEKLLKVIPFDDKGQLMLEKSINIREGLVVVDFIFLYGCSNPTIAALCQGPRNERLLRTFEVLIKEQKYVVGSMRSQSEYSCHYHGLIPVPPPLCGVMVIGGPNTVYTSTKSCKRFPTGCVYGTMSMPRANGSLKHRADKEEKKNISYLLGSDVTGNLHQLVITHVGQKVTNIDISILGKASFASTISYLDEQFVFVGSRREDSQLIKLKLNLPLDSEDSYIEPVESYINFGPIRDMCMVDLGKQGQRQVLTCSGSSKDGSLRIVPNGLVIIEQASVKLQGIKGMWSLRSATNNNLDTILVISLVGVTKFLEMKSEKKLQELKEEDINGFCSQEPTLVCQNAIHDQYVQVTPSSIRLVRRTSRELCYEWKDQRKPLISVATANPSQVLLSTGGGRLLYLKVRKGKLKLRSKSMQLRHDVSCLAINPIGDDPNCSRLAAVGTWKDICIRIFSLPGLQLLHKKHLEGEIVPRSILFGAFEGISYLFCALGDNLLNFLLNLNTGRISDGAKVSLGTQIITLYNFSCNNVTFVFAASDRPTVIYSSSKKLFYRDANLKEVSCVCPFNSAAFPDSLAIANAEGFSIGTIDDIQKIHIRSIPLGVQPISVCHMEQSQTFIICCAVDTARNILFGNPEYEQHCIRLLDDQTFECLSTLELSEEESITASLSCSFSDDDTVYYCVATKHNEVCMCRILVCTVINKELMVLCQKTEEKKEVHSLNVVDGKLLALIGKTYKLYKWEPVRKWLVLWRKYHGRKAAYAKTVGNALIVANLDKSVSLFTYEEGYGIEKLASFRHPGADNWKNLDLIETLDDDTYLFTREDGNMFTVRKNGNDFKLVGEYKLAGRVTSFCHGFVAMRLPNFDVGQIPTVIFGTDIGSIGIIASLPRDTYILLEKLQSILKMFIHVEEFHARRFLNGDLIESFLDLSRNQMDQVAERMNTTVGNLCDIVEELKRFH